MLYNERHKKDKRLNGIYAKKILWSWLKKIFLKNI
jgi:hypothetical protein